MSELYERCVQFLTKFWEGNPFSTFDLLVDYDDDDGITIGRKYTIEGLSDEQTKRLKKVVISENFLKSNASSYNLTGNMGDLINNLMDMKGEGSKQIVYDPAEGTRPFTIDDLKNIRELRRLGKKVLSCAHKDSPIGKLSKELDIAVHLQFALAQRIGSGLAKALDWVKEQEKQYHDYLEMFDSATRFGKCAGKTARLSRLHRNNVSSHVLQIYVWEFICYSMKEIYENHEQLERDGITSFGEISLNEVCEIAETYNNSNFERIYDEFITEFDFRLGEQKLKITSEGIYQSLWDLICEIEELNIPNIWTKISSFYHLWSLEQQIRDLKKLKTTLEQSYELYEELRMKIESKTPHYFDGSAAKLKKFVPSLTEEFLRYGKYDLNLATKSDDSNPVVIFGNPGYGKTIQLRQYAHEFTEEQFENLDNYNNLFLPILVKAKHLAKYTGKIASEPYAIDLEEGGRFEGVSISNKAELREILVNAVIESDSKMSENVVRNVLEFWDFSKMVIMIDAYDECDSKNDRIQILNVISDDFSEQGIKAIMTCRNSHQKELIENFSNFDSGEFTQLDVVFNENELKRIMPRKLANAWGIGGDNIAYQVQEKFEQYEAVLTHPLFVGLFCRLLIEDRLEDIKHDIKEMDMKLKGGMELHHINFLTQVIDIGLEISVKERSENEVDESRLNKLRTVFCHMAVANHVYKFKNLNWIFEYVEDLMEISLDRTDKKHLKENLGIIYATDGKGLDWVHPTIPEVATGIAFNQNKDYEYLFSSDSSIADFWSECLILTMASYDQKIDSKYKLYTTIHDMLPVLDNHSTRRTLNMLNHGRTRIFSELIYENGTLTGKFCDDIDPIEQNIGKIFIQCANDGKPFALRKGAFDENKNLILAYNLYMREQNSQIIDFPLPRSPVSFSEPELIEYYFETSNKAHVISRSLQTYERYHDLYSEDEVSKFFSEMAVFIENNDLGKFSLSNGRWVKIFDMLLKPGPWKVIIEPLLNKIQILDYDSRDLEDFWMDTDTKESIVIEEFPNLAKQVYENRNARLSLILLDSIASDMADAFERMYHYGTKKSHGWTSNHPMLKYLREDDVPEGTPNELRGTVGYLELILAVSAGFDTWDWLKHKALRYRHRRLNHYQRRIH